MHSFSVLGEDNLYKYTQNFCNAGVRNSFLYKFVVEIQNLKVHSMSLTDLYELFLSHPVITTDTRNCPEGSIFFALKGETFDGNLFAHDALAKGCAHAVVDNPQVVTWQVFTIPPLSVQVAFVFSTL